MARKSVTSSLCNHVCVARLVPAARRCGRCTRSSLQCPFRPNGAIRRSLMRAGVKAVTHPCLQPGWNFVAHYAPVASRKCAPDRPGASRGIDASSPGDEHAIWPAPAPGCRDSRDHFQVAAVASVGVALAGNPGQNRIVDSGCETKDGRGCHRQRTGERYSSRAPYVRWQSGARWQPGVQPAHRLAGIDGSCVESTRD